jgi:hypothetical protein
MIHEPAYDRTQEHLDGYSAFQEIVKLILKDNKHSSRNTPLPPGFMVPRNPVLIKNTHLAISDLLLKDE